MPKSLGFSGALSSAFAGRGAGGLLYIGPMMAQAEIARGAAWAVSGSGLLVGGRLLIGPAGKVYVFVSVDTAEKWAVSAGVVALREASILAGLDAAVADNWKEKKRARLRVIAARLVDAALLVGDAARRDALIAESSYCLDKWA